MHSTFFAGKTKKDWFYFAYSGFYGYFCPHQTGSSYISFKWHRRSHDDDDGAFPFGLLTITKE